MPEWEVRAAGRTDEMSQGKMSLVVLLQPDGDIILEIHRDGTPIQDEAGNIARVEFCSTAGGGGKSPHTRSSLVGLFKGIKKDGREYPDGVPKFPVYLKEHMENDPG